MKIYNDKKNVGKTHKKLVQEAQKHSFDSFVCSEKRNNTKNTKNDIKFKKHQIFYIK